MRLIDLQRDFLGWLASGDDEAAARLPLADPRGLRVYQNNYRGALMACLAESFPQTLLWLGEAAFEGAAARHIDRVPPSSWTLDDYARDFPESLCEDYPYDQEVGELARIELALSQTFIAADARPLQLDQMAHVDWDRAILQTIPALVILPLQTNAADIWIALAEDLPPPATQWAKAQSPLLVWRLDALCRLRSIDADEAAMLACMADGVPFADLCATAIAQWGEEEGLTRTGQGLSRWVGDGLITVLEQ